MFLVFVDMRSMLFLNVDWKFHFLEFGPQIVLQGIEGHTRQGTEGHTSQLKARPGKSSDAGMMNPNEIQVKEANASGHRFEPFQISTMLT